jgi:hypothetical protein
MKFHEGDVRDGHTFFVVSLQVEGDDVGSASLVSIQVTTERAILLSFMEFLFSLTNNRLGYVVDQLQTEIDRIDRERER